MSQPTFAIELLRDYVLTDLLGDDYAQVIYWSGKRVARKFPVMTNDELSAFFMEAGWGQLTLLKEKGNKFLFELLPPPATQEKATGYFQLEAGFLAEQIAGRSQCVAEGYADVARQAVQITVQLDRKDTYE
ncbi:YslB family protein [Exiguobacterium mexicanum]|uniref:YslB family protein n=1 Tax=Exiguobacterium mexicanum TaxID=340146 RepID=A0ABT7MLG9_9BACL|nr:MULTISPECIES: YslB family protein [Exiguobacterium]MDL5375576.1 YslB family protein [Exiguobacterium mexicanum]